MRAHARDETSANSFILHIYLEYVLLSLRLRIEFFLILRASFSVPILIDIILLLHRGVTAKAFIEKATSNYVVDDKNAPAADDEGLPGSKKHFTLLDGPSPKDYVCPVSPPTEFRTYKISKIGKKGRKGKERKESVLCVPRQVLSFDGPLRQESIRKGQKLQASGLEIQYIKAKLSTSGLRIISPDVMKEAKDFIEKAASNSVVDDESAPAADDEGLPGSKKCSTLLDGPSPKD
nr:hypothetical protein [Tanacetum cinerariifolium]